MKFIVLINYSAYSNICNIQKQNKTMSDNKETKNRERILINWKKFLNLSVWVLIESDDSNMRVVLFSTLTSSVCNYETPQILAKLYGKQTYSNFRHINIRGVSEISGIILTSKRSSKGQHFFFVVFSKLTFLFFLFVSNERITG